MGTRGPLKLARGLEAVPAATEGTAAADVPALAPDKPAIVANDPDLSAAWDLIVPELDRAGLVSPADLPSIVLALSHYVIATRAYREIGPEVAVADLNHGGVKKHPAEAVLRAESEQFLKYAAQLGMTFVSRARTPSTHAGEDSGNPFMLHRGSS